jgi:hypothetical protein
MASSILPGIGNTLWNNLQFWKDIPDDYSVKFNMTSKYVTKTEYVDDFIVVEPILKKHTILLKRKRAFRNCI